MPAEVIVALDVPTIPEMLKVVDELGDSISFYKVGLEIYTAEGPAVVRQLKDRGKRVFLDLKLHDIPRTVANAVTAAARHGVDLLTIHSVGGRTMIGAAREAARAAGAAGPKLLAITTLTSLDQSDLTDIGVLRDLETHTLALGGFAVRAGADGLVCSPLEVAAMRQQVGAETLLVTPGVRPSGGEMGDQKRVATPSAASRDGATHLVIGRPIVQAPDRKAAAEAILAELAGA